jgi:hypothetical protein
MQQPALDFVVDKLTDCIENVITGDSFFTEISILTQKELSTVSKLKGWLFDWKTECRNPGREVYKLTIVGNPTVIQGVISLEVKPDHVYMHLIESAPFNKGQQKVYAGVPANLVAFACKVSFQRGHEGNVAFMAKPQLIAHYVKTLGATHFGGQLMLIEMPAALTLTGKYFKS